MNKHSQSKNYQLLMLLELTRPQSLESIVISACLLIYNNAERFRLARENRRQLLPMILMASYMFWGIYMLVGALKPSVMIKGFIMIVVLSLVPSLWAIVDHLDDKLWDAMYGGVGDPIEMMIIDAATSMFQVGIVFILFHWVNLAGGGDAGGALNPTQKHADNFGRNTGRAAGTVTGKVTPAVGKARGLTGTRGENRDWKGK